MIVHQFSAFPYGGAGSAALRHHLELRQQGIDSRFHHRAEVEFASSHRSIGAMPIAPAIEPRGFWARRFERYRRRKIIRQYERHLTNRDPRFELFTQPEMLDKTSLTIRATGDTVLHLHWLSFLIDYPSFFRSIPADVPIVWTLHDMNAFTGGCHFSGSCTHFASGCGRCPQIVAASARDVSRDSFKTKKKALTERKIDVVAPSRWMMQLAAKSPIWPTGTEFHVIPYGFDLRLYRPIPKSVARRQLGLPQNVALIAFGADDLDNPRKGTSLLLRALRQMGSASGMECLVFGKGSLPSDRSGLPIVHEFGFVAKPEIQAAIYASADIFVLPSLEDNSPQTGLEAMACGTPVVAFESGGIPEFVHPGQTGLLVAVGNVADLARQLRDLIDHPRLRQRLSVGARRFIEREHDIRKQVRPYIDLYQLSLGKSASGPQSRAA